MENTGWVSNHYMKEWWDRLQVQSSFVGVVLSPFFFEAGVDRTGQSSYGERQADLRHRGNIAQFPGYLGEARRAYKRCILEYRYLTPCL